MSLSSGFFLHLLGITQATPDFTDLQAPVKCQQRQKKNYKRKWFKKNKYAVKQHHAVKQHRKTNMDTKHYQRK